MVALSRGNSPSAETDGKPRGELPGLNGVERSEGCTCKACARLWPKERRHCPLYRSERTACRADGPRRVVKSRRPTERVFKTTIPSHPFQILPPQTVMETSGKLKWPPPRRRPGRRRLSPKPQQSLSRLLGSLRRNQPRVSIPQPLNPQLPTWWSQTNVPPPHSRKVVISITWLAIHVWSWPTAFSHPSPLSPQGRLPAGCPEDRHSLLEKILQHSLLGRSELTPAHRLLELEFSARQEAWTEAFSQPARCRYLSFKWDFL